MHNLYKVTQYIMDINNCFFALNTGLNKQILMSTDITSDRLRRSLFEHSKQIAF